MIQKYFFGLWFLFSSVKEGCFVQSSQNTGVSWREIKNENNDQGFPATIAVFHVSS